MGHIMKKTQINKLKILQYKSDLLVELAEDVNVMETINERNEA